MSREVGRRSSLTRGLNNLRADDVVAIGCESYNGEELSSLAAGSGNCSNPSFKRCDPLFENFLNAVRRIELGRCLE